ncbi:MAG: hypothetical protein E7Z89_06935 [Cyanobacteria bacterium SIG28]|nr:hypothetical protein [Cyanobacteria bacterium SIG28]
MKRLLLISSFLISIPAFATCSIDGLSCSLAEFQKPPDTTYSTKPIINEFAGTPEARLKPNENTADKKMLRDFGPNNSEYGYNTNCQFGVCYERNMAPLFKQQKQ